MMRRKVKFQSVDATPRLAHRGWRTALAGTLFCLAASTAGASPRLISIGVSASGESPQQIGADVMRRDLAARFGQRIGVDERCSISIGSENALLAAVQAGALDITVATGPVAGVVVPDFSVFDVPFLFRDSAHVKAVADGPIGKAIAAKFAEKGLVLLAIGEQGLRNVTNSKHPIRSAADLRGLKIRVLPNDVYKMTFQAFGADVVPMEFPLVYGALKEGRIDAEENPVQVVAANRLNEVQKYISLTGHFYAPVVFMMNRETFDSLDPKDQAAVMAAAQAAADATRKYGADSTAKNLQILKTSGMDVVENVDRQSFVDALKPLEPEFEKRFGRQVLDAIRATR